MAKHNIAITISDLNQSRSFVVKLQIQSDCIGYKGWVNRSENVVVLTYTCVVNLIDAAIPKRHTFVSISNLVAATNRYETRVIALVKGVYSSWVDTWLIELSDCNVE